MTSVPIDRLRSVGVPSATRRPASMMPTRSASTSASSRYCVVRKIVMPSSTLSRRTSSHTAARLTGSRPVVGSSRNRICGVVDERRGQVEPAPHAARIRADASIEGVTDVDQLAQLGDAAVGVGSRQAVEQPLQAQQLRTRLAWIERRILQRHADAQAYARRVVDDVEPGDRRRAARRTRSTCTASAPSSTCRPRWVRGSRRSRRRRRRGRRRRPRSPHRIRRTSAVDLIAEHISVSPVVSVRFRCADARTAKSVDVIVSPWGFDRRDAVGVSDERSVNQVRRRACPELIGLTAAIPTGRARQRWSRR